MRRTFLILLLAATFAGNAAAQSGRRGVTPTPPRSEPLMPPPLVSQPEPAPMTPVKPAELSSLPEGLLTREIKSIDKGSFSLGDFGGKVVVVNLWATWCGPCRREIPDYERVRKEYAGRAVEFIGLTTEDPRTSADRVKQFAHDVNFGFRLGYADRETAFILMNGQHSIPQTLVIAADGQIISHWSGYGAQSRDRLREAIKRALSEAPATASGFR
jgi:thiol-disulfide isomerase/thioredoxin